MATCFVRENSMKSKYVGRKRRICQFDQNERTVMTGSYHRHCLVFQTETCSLTTFPIKMIPGSLLTNTDHALSCFPCRGRSVNMNLRVNNLHYFYCNKSDPGPHGEGRGHVVLSVLSQLQFSQWVVLQVSRNLQVALSISI